jgi:hypothetical protein
MEAKVKNKKEKQQDVEVISCKRIWGWFDALQCWLSKSCLISHADQCEKIYYHREAAHRFIVETGVAATSICSIPHYSVTCFT